MKRGPREVTEFHTRLSRCALEVDETRAYWAHAVEGIPADPRQAFEEYWFGARSLARVKVLLTNMRARFDTFPTAINALHHWPDMSPESRRVICHWHLQLSDPFYRKFAGAYLVERRNGMRPEVTRDLVVGWVTKNGPSDWAMTMRVQFASKLLSAAHSAALVTSNRDPRPIGTPLVPDDALEYLLYLLRETRFKGGLLDNPYLRSVGLAGAVLDERLRGLRGLDFHRQGDLVDLGWQHQDLAAWAEARVGQGQLVGATS